MVRPMQEQGTVLTRPTPQRQRQLQKLPKSPETVTGIIMHNSNILPSSKLQDMDVRSFRTKSAYAGLVKSIKTNVSLIEAPLLEYTNQPHVLFPRIQAI